jgi:UDP-glucose 4-epimerase
LSSSPIFTEDPRKGTEVNVIGFMNVMESARRNRVKKVIYASSSSLYNGRSIPYKETDMVTPKTFYESSFYCRETMARTYYLEYGLNSVGLRYFSVYGPNEKHKGRFANNVSQFTWDIIERKKSPVIYGDGSQTRDFIFVEDVVQANVLAMRKEVYERGEQRDNRGPPNNVTRTESTGTTREKDSYDRNGFRIYNIGTGIQTSFNKVIELISKELGTVINPIYIDNPVKHYVQHTRADISRARGELGFEPRWKNIEEGIRRIINDSGHFSVPHVEA